MLDCQSENLNQFDSETIDLLTLFSTQASMALQNARLYSLERRRAPQLEAINAIAQANHCGTGSSRNCWPKFALLIQKCLPGVPCFRAIEGRRGTGVAGPPRHLTPRFRRVAGFPPDAGLWGRALGRAKH